MKRVNLILIIILSVLMAGCGGKKQSGNYDFITVDVAKSFSSIKELFLQDFMDVEYIVLETKDDFINQGFVHDVGKEILLVSNRSNDGDIFVYDRKGKALRKINRKGQGSEEYSNITGITLDDDNNEMYVNNHFAKNILVYDLFGNFKRRLKQEEGQGLFYTDIFNYDKDNLICFSKTNQDGIFVIVSKKDGRITKKIKVPFSEKKLIQENGGTEDSENPGFFRQTITYKGNWLLSEHSTDTTYLLLPDYSLLPFIVRTPSIHSMNPEIFLILRFFSDRYYFMETFYNDYDYDSETSGFPVTCLMYDKKEKDFLGYNLYNGDYSTPRKIYMNFFRPVNHEIESCLILKADQLVESNKKGELKGKLKEIAANLNEESNPVIMLIKHRNK